MMKFCLSLLIIFQIGAREPLASRIAHTDPSRYRQLTAVHEGAGHMAFSALFDEHTLETNLQFLHRGVISPRSGIGQHFHNQCEEMFVILDGEAQFTIDGRTSVLKGPAGAICRMGHSHAIYNASDNPVQWMNINVTVLYRRMFSPSVFNSPWTYVDHLVLPPNTSIGAHVHHELEEFYYVLRGQGAVTVAAGRSAAETASIKGGDAIPLRLGDIKFVHQHRARAARTSGHWYIPGQNSSSRQH